MFCDNSQQFYFILEIVSRGERVRAVQRDPMQVFLAASPAEFSVDYSQVYIIYRLHLLRRDPSANHLF